MYGTINPIEPRKRKSQWPQIGLAVLLLSVLGFAAWYMFIRMPGELPAADWTTHQGDGYSIRMPGTPEVSSRTDSADEAIHLATVELPSRVYGVAWSEFDPERLANFGEAELLEFAMREGMTAIDGVITDSFALDWKGHAGREFKASIPGGRAHYRFLLVGTRMYRLAIIHAPGFVPDTETFFESLEVS